jgi:hypothetical protein
MSCLPPSRALTAWHFPSRSHDRAESRGAHAREDYPARNNQNWKARTLTWRDARNVVHIGSRPVHTYTLTNEIKYMPPEARVYEGSKGARR